MSTATIVVLLDFCDFDPEKVRARMLFNRRGKNRRQDHGSRGNADNVRIRNPRYNQEKDFICLAKCKDHRRGGTLEME